MPVSRDAQSLSVKRAEVEFHNFASLGEPERAIATYSDENVRRGAILRDFREFIGPLTPFVEIGANAGHTVVTDKGVFKFHLIPSGILHPASFILHPRSLHPACAELYPFRRSNSRMKSTRVSTPLSGNAL